MTTFSTWHAAALLAALLAVPPAHAAEVAGVRLDDRLRVGEQELVLNGAGLRSKLFIKVYVGALYVAQKSTAAVPIIDSPAPRRMVLRLLRDVDADTLYGALHDGLKDNNGEAELAALQPQVDEFAGIMRRIGAARRGDSIVLDFAADGVVVAHNGEARGKVVGASFGRALLRVWLGERPVDASLKKALLGS